jgi:predicted transposase YbfD/YdcC
VEKGHGRIEKRQTHVYRIHDPMQLGLFGSQTLLKTYRERTDLKTKKTSKETVFHLCTSDVNQYTAENWASLVRDHWGIESKNHNRRDVTLLEDKTKSKNKNIVANMAVARAALLFFNSTENENGTLPKLVENINADISYPVRLITRKKHTK